MLTKKRRTKRERTKRELVEAIKANGARELVEAIKGFEEAARDEGKIREAAASKGIPPILAFGALVIFGTPNQKRAANLGLASELARMALEQTRPTEKDDGKGEP